MQILYITAAMLEQLTGKALIKAAYHFQDVRSTFV